MISSVRCTFSTPLIVLLFQALCLCVPTSFLKATAVPVAPLPFLPQRSQRRLLFCCVPMSFRRRRTRRCCRPRCRASGRTTSGCRRSRRARWLASSKSPSCCATSTSPVSLPSARTNTQISREKDANRTMRLYACFFVFFFRLCTFCKSRHIHIRILFSLSVTAESILNPWPACWWGSMQINSHERKKKRHFQHPFMDWPVGSSQAASVCYARVLLLVCMIQYVCGCVPHVCVRVCMCASLLLYFASNTWQAGLNKHLHKK